MRGDAHHYYSTADLPRFRLKLAVEESPPNIGSSRRTNVSKPDDGVHDLNCLSKDDPEGAYDSLHCEERRCKTCLLFPDEAV